MAKRKAARRPGARKTSSRARKTAKKARGAAQRPAARKSARKAQPRGAKKKTSARKSTRKAGPRATTKPFGPPPGPGQGTRTKASRIDRERRRLEETVAATPPSSLDMDRRSSAARSGRAELAESLKEHTGMTPAITGGDVDADWEQAYFSGEEAPGGDNPTPDQDIVDDIGRSLGVEYQDNEELKSSDKVAERDKHRWELDPASAEDYKDRKG